MSVALTCLSSEERAAVLDDLLRDEPRLRERAERLAAQRLSVVDREGVAEEVAWLLVHLPTDELATRCGRVPGRGYVEPDESAFEMCEEELRPFLDDIDRRAGLGFRDTARTIGLGVLEGLYRATESVADGTVLAAAGEDAPLGLAESVCAAMADAGVEVHSGVLDEVCPDWASSLR